MENVPRVATYGQIVLGVTSLRTRLVASAEGTEYEVQWRAVSYELAMARGRLRARSQRQPI